ncbi:MAG: RNA polymerase alpha subunit C-terminal domain-containing protein [Bacteroidota bacterium]
MKKTLRTCKNGHQYYKSSDCPVCPKCENERKPESGFLEKISAPARRALENNGIKTLKELANFSEKEILEFHGLGPGSIPKLKEELSKKGLSFRNS